jgi:hypothetical protein
MVVRKNNSSLIIKNSESDEEPDKRGYGKLIWPKFYGPSRPFDHWRYNPKILLITVSIGSVLIFLTGTSLYIITGMTNYFAEIYTLVFSFILPIIYWLARRRDKTSMDCYYIVKRGDLDWDLYENGMLERNYSEDAVNYISEEFNYFSNYPIVYYNIGEWHIKAIWDHVRIVAKRARELDGGEYDKDYFDTWEEGRTEYIKSCIWFFDGKDGQEDFEMERDWLKDSKRFETILHQKIKKVI